MALTLNNIWSPTHGTLFDAVATNGTPTVSNANPRRTGSYSYIADGGGRWIELDPFENIADAGSDYIIGIAMQVKSSITTPKQLYFSVQDGTGQVFEIRGSNQFDGDVSLELRDANGSLLETLAGCWDQSATYGYIEVHFQHSASGTIQLFCYDDSDGSRVETSQYTSQDLTAGGLALRIRLGGSSDTPPPVNAYTDIYWLSGVTDVAERFGDFEIFGDYRSTNGISSDLGNNASAGVWSGSWEIPLDSGIGITMDGDPTLVEGAVFSNDAGGSASTGGPNTDGKVDGDGDIKAAKYLWRLSRGNGGGTTHWIFWGNSGDSNIIGMESASVTLTTSEASFIRMSLTDLVLSDEYLAIGVGADGARVMSVQGIHAQIGHVPAPPVSLPPVSPLRYIMPQLVR